MKKLFFSIVIPAHNEEKYIDNTLQNIAKINYPKDLHQIIVVENASLDKTYNVAKKYESENIKIVRTKIKGVSNARNLGAKKCSEMSDWIIYLDADTILKKEFLNELNKFLVNKKDFVIGTCKLEPIEVNNKSKVFFNFFDFCHNFFSFSASIQIQKYSLSKVVKYDEKMNIAEDTKFIKDNKKFGKFFYMKTNNVLVSTRRLEKKGYIKMLYLWLTQTLINRDYSKYDVVR